MSAISQKALALLAAATTLAAAPVWADPIDPYVNQISNQLVHAIRVAREAGFSVSHEPHAAILPRSGRQDVTVNLRAGKAYRILGVCDDDCRDLDMALYDENGKLIDKDQKDNDLPAVSVTPRWDGPFTVRTTMASCRTGQCLYGFEVFAR